MEGWVHTPVGINAQRWVTQAGCRSVLVVVHSVACAQRLSDVVSLLRTDTRIQVVFTVAPSIFHRGVAEWLAAMDCVVIPWSQAEQTRFDLAVAASYWGIERVHAPLVLVPHGAGFNKVMVPSPTGSASAPRDTFGLDRQRLVHDGRVIPSVLVVAHEQERRRLARTCPEALPVALVAGDPVADRLQEALRAPQRFRAALGVQARQRLAVVASTWGSRSALGARSDIVSRLVHETREHPQWQVALLAHPNVWAAHGSWQMRSWMADWRTSGLILLPQATDCVGVLAAADAVIGDHGSTTLYATRLGRPVALSDSGVDDVDADSPMAELVARTPRIPGAGSLLAWLDSLIATWAPGRLRSVAAQVTSYPGAFAPRMRHALYAQLDMAEPARPACLPVTDTSALEQVAKGGSDA